MTVGAAAGGFSQALKVSASSTAEKTIEYFIRVSLVVER